MLRLFTALEIDHSSRLNLSYLPKTLSGAHFIEPDNYHITLCFYGKVDHIQADQLRAEIERYYQKTQQKNYAPLTMDRLDILTQNKTARLVALIKAEPELINLQKTLAYQAQRIGIKLEKRKFKPHITLARLDNSTPDQYLAYIIANNQHLGRSFHAPQLKLLSSHISRGGGPYITEAAWPRTPLPI